MARRPWLECLTTDQPDVQTISEWPVADRAKYLAMALVLHPAALVTWQFSGTVHETLSLVLPGVSQDVAMGFVREMERHGFVASNAGRHYIDVPPEELSNILLLATRAYMRHYHPEWPAEKA